MADFKVGDLVELDGDGTCGAEKGPVAMLGGPWQVRRVVGGMLYLSEPWSGGGWWPCRFRLVKPASPFETEGQRPLATGLPFDPDDPQPGDWVVAKADASATAVVFASTNDYYLTCLALDNRDAWWFSSREELRVVYRPRWKL